jgi:hypothetical protein
MTSYHSNDILYVANNLFVEIWGSQVHIAIGMHLCTQTFFY